MNMSRSTATPVTAVLPITALHTIEYGGQVLLLAGKGSVLAVVDAHSRRTLTSCPVLHRQAIHGIITFQPHAEVFDEGTIHLLLFGGKQIAWSVLRLELSKNGLLRLSVTTASTITAKDWILCCKPALVGSTFLTSSNALYHVTAENGSNCLTSEIINDEIGSFLYSGNFVQRNENCYLVTSGTVFGQVLVWSCNFLPNNCIWTTIRIAQLEGHNGSIFDVAISARPLVGGKERLLIISCSDDRMIYVWDLATGEYQQSSIVDKHKEFYRHDRPLLKTYAHMSRIWGVDLFWCEVNDVLRPLVISTGEDGQSQTWSLSLPKDPSSRTASIDNRYTDRHHAGKNIWSRCHSERGNFVDFVTGGADGRIVARKYDPGGRANFTSRYIREAFRSVQLRIPTMSTASKPTALKSYLSLGDGCFMAAADGGHLLRGSYTSSAYIEWQVVPTDAKTLLLINNVVSHSRWTFFLRQSDSALCGIPFQSVQVYEVCHMRPTRVAGAWSSSSSSISQDCVSQVCIAITYYGCDDIELTWLEVELEQIKRTGTSSLALPATFEVTSVLYDEEQQVFLCGSRAGALALYTDITSRTISASPHVCHRHVHGQDTLTSIHKLEDMTNCYVNPFFLTTGRDGTYSVHKIDRPNEGELCFSTVHKATLPIGPQIEGANICSLRDGNPKLLFHGFRSKNFVVWNETDQRQVMNVECGGAHRSWTFQLDDNSEHAGTFIWTKAGNIAVCRQETADHEILQEGGHGREIKALAVHQLANNVWLLATGSEDTDIRLFEYTERSPETPLLRCVSVIRKHTTGLQSLSFSPDGKMLISAAGMEELYAWQLSTVPVLGQGVLFACSLLSDDAKSDARIMHFDIRAQSHHRTGDVTSYLLTVALSNGRLKMVQLDPGSPTSRARFQILRQIDFGSICLTQAHFVHNSTDSLHPGVMVGATNGYLSLQEFPLISPKTATTGTSPSTSAHLLQHKVHLNSITALQALALTPAHQVVVTGGDDSALALTLICQGRNADNNRGVPTFRTTIIPNAHAAALTAIQVIRIQTPSDYSSAPGQEDHNSNARISKQSFTIITAGNDQSLQVWHMTIDTQTLEDMEAGCSAVMSQTMEEVNIEFCDEYYTNVADISEIAVLHGVDRSIHEELHDGVNNDDKGKQESIDVLIVGVGMEVLRLTRPDPER